VFKPILAALTERSGDAIKAQGYVFIIGASIALIAAALTYFFVSSSPSSCSKSVMLTCALT
jgi:hypothetical protein